MNTHNLCLPLMFWGYGVSSTKLLVLHLQYQQVKQGQTQTVAFLVMSRKGTSIVDQLCQAMYIQCFQTCIVFNKSYKYEHSVQCKSE